MKSLGGPLGIIAILVLVLILNSFLIFSLGFAEPEYTKIHSISGGQTPSGAVIAAGINPSLLYYGAGVLGFFLIFITYLILSKGYKFGKITKKVIVIVLSLSILPIAVIGVINIQMLLQSEGDTVNIMDAYLTEHGRASMTADIKHISENIELTYDDILHSFSVIANSPLIAENLQDWQMSHENTTYTNSAENKSRVWWKLNNYFNTIYDTYGDQIEDIQLFYKDGQIINELNYTEDDQQLHRETEYWFPQTIKLCESIQKGQYFISPLSFSKETNSTIIRYAHAIRVGGDCAGVFKINFNAHTLTDQIKGFKYSDNGYALLIDYNYKNSEGRTLSWPVVLSHSDTKGPYQISEEPYDAAEYAEKYLIGDFGFLSEEPYEKDNVLIAYQKVNIENRQWYVFVVVPKDKVVGMPAAISNELSEIYENNIYLFILSILGTFSAIIIAGFIISEQLTKPIIELGVISKEIESGNFAARTVVDSNDEIGDLAKTLNRTLETLDKTDRERKRIDHMKTEFISITSHELRSPMTPMRAQLQMLMKGYFGKLSKKQRDSLDIVLRNTERLDNIIKDFLEISRIEAARLKFNFVSTNLKPHIQRLVKEMGNFMPEKNIKIETKIGGLPEMEVDPDRVMQVLRNLTNNAIKFTPEKGTIKITVEARDEGLLFSIKDTGIGIKRQDQIRIFEPFFQAEQTMYRKYEGTGLGLAISKGIIESQNGSIWLESDIGHGTTFYFTVPYVPVREIKPIKVLFSTKSELEARIEDLFTEILGPIGKRELESLKIENKLDEKGFREYVKILQKMGVLNQERAKIFGAEIIKTIEGHEKEVQEKNRLSKTIKKIKHKKDEIEKSEKNSKKFPDGPNTKGKANDSGAPLPKDNNIDSKNTEKDKK